MALTMKTVGRICMWLSIVVAVFYVNNALYVYGTVSKCVSPFVGSNDHTLKMWYDLGQCPHDYTNHRDVWYESTGVSHPVIVLISTVSALWVVLPVFFGGFFEKGQRITTIWYIGTLLVTTSTFFIHMEIASSKNSDCSTPFTTECTSIGMPDSAHPFDLDDFNSECQAGVLDLVAPMFHQNKYNSWNMYDGCESGEVLFATSIEEFPSEFCNLHDPAFFETGWFMVNKDEYFATGARKVISTQSIIGLVSLVILLVSVVLYTCMVWPSMFMNSPATADDQSIVGAILSVLATLGNAGIMITLTVVYITERKAISDPCHGNEITYLPLTNYHTPNKATLQNLLPVYASVPVLAALVCAYKIFTVIKQLCFKTESTFVNNPAKLRATSNPFWLDLLLGVASFLAYLPFVLVLAHNGANVCNSPIPYEFTNSILSLMVVSSAVSVGALEINLSAQSNFAYYGLF
jgi:hypothetical protein